MNSIVETKKETTKNNSKASSKKSDTKASTADSSIRDVFNSLDCSGSGKIEKDFFLAELSRTGISKDDNRISDMLQSLEQHKDSTLSYKEFKKITSPNAGIIEKSLRGDFVIPEFDSFCETLTTIFKETGKLTAGNVAESIPQLKRVLPTKYGMAVCTVDGQQFDLGDSTDRFVVQSTCKPISYCLALEEHSEEFVHKHVGREPSGTEFNALSLNNIGLPHNPMINAGSIMCSSMIRQDLDIAERFDYVLNKWNKLSGTDNVSFNNSVYLSEKKTADRNFALGYFMKEKGSFPENTDLIESLEFYFQCCSIELNCKDMASIAATLANGGINPLIEERVLRPNTVKNCLSLMSSCGMYDFSGEYAFGVGLPSKSGISGVVMIVVPNVLGITIWSPPIDPIGNSVKGLAFSKKLIENFNFHNYDSLHTTSNKIDPRQQKNAAKFNGVISACWAASQGDLNEIKRLVANGVDINDSDYDGRTPLHLAASEGHDKIVQYLALKKVNLNCTDRWGGRPLDDAKRGNHKKCISILTNEGAKL